MNYGRRHLILRASAASVVTLLATTVLAQTGYQGMSLFGYGSNLGNPDLYESLYDMKTLGVDTVALNTWWQMDSKTASVVHENVGGMSASRGQIENAIDLIHSLGMKVYFKPNVDPADGVWRALINPADPNAWFTSYGDYLNSMADLAQQKGVELFSIGTEMESMANKAAYAPKWTSIIGNVRSRYNGPVTYAGNGGDAYDGSTNYGSYQRATFWDQLDYIGVDAYFQLTNKNNPTPAELNAAWSARADSIDGWRDDKNLLNKPVLFTEIGYGAYDGSNRTPWGDDSHIPDAGEQRDAYNALLTVMSQRPWWKGAFWWSWETQPHAGVHQPTGFTPQDRVAMQTLANFYGGAVPPPAPRPNQLFAGFEAGLDGFTANDGATIGLTNKGVTEGATSLAITTPGQGFHWALANNMNSNSSGNKFLTLSDAAADPTGHALAFDVTYRTDSIPQSQVSDIRMYVAMNSPVGWSQVDNLAIANGRSNQTLSVSIPMTQFPLTATSQWYSVNFAVAGNWGNAPATIYLDNIRIIDLTPGPAGDFDGNGVVEAADLASLEYAFGLFHHGDANGDGDTDGADLLLYQRQLAVPGASAAGGAVPEPTAVALVVLGIVGAALGARARATTCSSVASATFTVAAKWFGKSRRRPV